MLRITLYICNSILVSGLMYTRQSIYNTMHISIISLFRYQLPIIVPYLCMYKKHFCYIFANEKKQTRLTRTLLPSLMHDLAYL